MKKKHETNPRLGRVGGEAVLEGVMMRCGDRYSIASRHEDGSISVENRNYVSLRKRNRFWNLPLVRGVVSLVESMKLSFKVLSISADALGMDMDEPESKFEKWLAKTFGDKVMNAIMGVAGFLGVVLGIGRALGEAMAINMVAGGAVNLPLPFNSVRFLTTQLVSEMGYAEGTHRQVLFTVGLVLYLFIMIVNLVLQRLRREGGKDNG